MNTKKITFGGGRFWCTQAIFQQLHGVNLVETGYSGGVILNPTYIEVNSGTTGHAEVIEITYDPGQISLTDLLRIHLRTHNPTTELSQDEDVGAQFKSIIFYRDEADRMTALSTIEEMQQLYDHLIVTELKPLVHFYKAEDDHQDYYHKNTQAGYCQSVIAGKLKKFKSLFAEKLKE